MDWKYDLVDKTSGPYTVKEQKKAIKQALEETNLQFHIHKEKHPVCARNFPFQPVLLIHIILFQFNKNLGYCFLLKQSQCFINSTLWSLFLHPICHHHSSDWLLNYRTHSTLCCMRFFHYFSEWRRTCFRFATLRRSLFLLVATFSFHSSESLSFKLTPANEFSSVAIVPVKVWSRSQECGIGYRWSFLDLGFWAISVSHTLSEEWRSPVIWSHSQTQMISNMISYIIYSF